MNYTVDQPIRLDRFLAEKIPDQTRAFLQQLIEEGLVSVDGCMCVKKSLRLKPNQVVEIQIPQAEPVCMQPENLNLSVLYEDSTFVAFFKPAGMLTHPNHAEQEATLVHGALHHIQDLQGIKGELRPGIVHRLDRMTSGLILVAKSLQSQAGLQAMFASRQVQKYYYAVCAGRINQVEGEIEAPIGRDPKRRHLQRIDSQGRYARTSYRVLKSWDRVHFVRIRIHTGRTHQIRVHLKHAGMPVFGDQEYGGRLEPKWCSRFLLHSFSLRFRHPVSGKELYIRAPLPQDMRDVIRRLNNGR